MKTISRNFLLFFIGLLCLLKISGCDTPLSLGSKVNTSVPVIQNADGEVAPGGYLNGALNTVLLDVTQEFGLESVYMTYWYTGEDGIEYSNTIEAYLNDDGLYAVNIDTRGMRDGSIRAQVTATDISGNVTTTTDLVYFVKNNPPQIELTLPKLKGGQFDDADLNAAHNTPSNAIYLGSDLMGIATDMYGIAAGFPRIMMWPADYAAVDSNGIPFDSDLKWGVWRTMRDDKGNDLTEEDLKATQFRWPMFEPIDNGDGTWRIPVEGKDDNLNDLATGNYRVRLWVRDLFDVDNFYPNRTDNELGVSAGNHPNKYIIVPLVASVSPRVTFNALPEYYNGDGALQVRVQVTSSNTIRTVRVNISHNESSSGFDDSITMTLNDEGVYVGNIFYSDIEKWLGDSTNGQKFVQVEAVDTQNYQAQSSRMITIDNQTPTLDYTAPAGLGAGQTEDLPRVTSTVILRAVAEDNILVARLYYSLGVNATAQTIDSVRYQSVTNPDANASRGWTDTLLHNGTGLGSHPGSSTWGGTLSSFNWTFEDIAVFCTGSDNQYVSSYGNRNDNLWYLPVKFKVVDAAGNVAIYSTAMIVDPDADIPVVEINSHTNFQIVGGQVRVSGTATDNEMIYDVEIRVTSQVDNDCDTDRAPSKAETNDFVSAIIVGTKSSMASWYYNLNADGSLNPPSTKGHRRVLVELRARDAYIYTTSSHAAGDPKQYGPITSLYLDFDNSVPVIENVQIIHSGPSGISSAARTDYSVGARVAGYVTMEAKIRDDGGIKSIKLRGDEIYAFGDTEKTSGVNPWVVLPTGRRNGDRLTIGRKYLIYTAGITNLGNLQDQAHATNEVGSTFIATSTGPISGSGSLLEATEGSGNAQYFGYTLYIPLETTTLDGGAFNQSAGSYTMDLQVDDNTSPMPYSTRQTFSLQIDNYYPMATYSGNLNALGAEYSISGRAWDTGNNISVQGLERVVVYFSRPGNDVNDMVGTPIDLDRDAENMNNWVYSSQSARTGRIVTEDGVIESQGVETTLPFFPKFSDDGRTSSSGIVVNDNGTYNGRYQTFTGNPAKDWSVRVNTIPLNDGPLNVHYVVFDSAGNATHNVQRIYIANKRPVISNIRLGTDINKDESVRDDEYLGFTPQNYNSGYGEITTNFRTRNDMFHLGLNLGNPGNQGNGAKEYRVSYVIQNAAVSALEIKKGQVYTIATPGDVQWINYGVYETLGNYLGATFTATNDYVGSASTTGRVYSYSDPKALAVTGNLADTTAQAIDFKDITSVPESDTSNTGEDVILRHNRHFLIKVWDSTVQGSGWGEADQLSHTVLINVDVNNDDRIKPRIAIDPFYWNSIGDNSLYLNSKNNGHIELEADLPSQFTNSGTGIMDRDPKVSGKISIRGTASDDNTLGAIYVRIEGFNGGGTLAETIEGTTYYQVATFSKGIWDTVTTIESGWAFSKESEILDQEGHKITWKLDFDTSKIDGVADTNREIRVIARDQAKTLHYTTPDTTQTTAVSPKSYYRVDVVPYISGIRTDNRIQGGLKPNNIRSADGKYSVIRGGTQDLNPISPSFITVEGFNLNPSSVRILNETDNTTYRNSPSSVPTGSKQFSASSIASSYESFTMTNDSDRSGYLTVVVNGIGTRNNINNNDAVGSYIKRDSSDGSDQENMPNREADRYTTKNITLTDDRYLQFYTVIKTDVRNGYYPVLIMDGDNPVFGYVDKSGGTSGEATIGANAAGSITDAGVFQPQNAMPQRTRFTLASGAREDTEYLIKASSWDQMAMARDDSGRYLHATNYSRDACFFTLVYDRYAELHRTDSGGKFAGDLFYGTAWGSTTVPSGYYGVWATDTFGRSTNDGIPYSNLTQYHNAIALDRNDTLTDRYLYPKLIAKGDSVDSSASYYMSYYDDVTGELIFRNFRIGEGNGAGSTQLFNYAEPLDAKDRQYKAKTNLTKTHNLGDTSSRKVAASEASKFFDMAVDKDDTVILVYYDVNAKRLVLQYSSTSINGSAPTNDVPWTSSPVNGSSALSNVGMYVSMVIDDDNHLHIAALTSDSSLRYIYIPNVTSATNVQSVTVDQYGSVGYWTSIKIHPTSKKPYIAYYNAAEDNQRDSIKIAWPNYDTTMATTVLSGVDGSGYTTGNWEYRTVPALDPPQGSNEKFQRVNLDFRANSSRDPILGYLGDYIEYSYPVGE